MFHTEALASCLQNPGAHMTMKLVFLAFVALAGAQKTFDLAAYKKAHPERFQHEYGNDEVAKMFATKDRKYTEAEIAAYKAEHPERFAARSHQHSEAQIAAYKAAHPERFERFGFEDCQELPATNESEAASAHHNYTAYELTIFVAGMAHAKQVAGYKAAHPNEFTPEAIVAYKEAHPGRMAVAAVLKEYTGPHELEVFRAGFEHYTDVVAPYMVEHPDAFSASKLAEYIFEHTERFAPFLKAFKSSP